MGSGFGSCGVISGCMMNAAFLELLTKSDPGCGTLVTFAQFVFITLEGLIFTSKFGTAPRHIPIKNYLLIVIMFFTTNVCNNYAFNFNIAMPLHMIFRSGSLIANMVLNVLIVKRSYSFSKYCSVLLITLGVVICTLITGKDLKTDSVSSVEDSGFFWWSLGIALLVFSLFVSALLGIYQEQLYKTYGKYPFEALFYTHMLPLPIFLLFWNNLQEHWNIAVNSTTLAVGGFAVPSLVAFLFGNVVTQYLCISSVYYLTTEASSLTVTLVLTLRKFLSLIISIVAFQNAFTFYHWVGTLCVFVGTVIFTELPQKLFSTGPSAAPRSKHNKNK